MNYVTLLSRKHIPACQNLPEPITHVIHVKQQGGYAGGDGRIVVGQDLG